MKNPYKKIEFLKMNESFIGLTIKDIHHHVTTECKLLSLVVFTNNKVHLMGGTNDPLCPCHIFPQLNKDKVKFLAEIAVWLENLEMLDRDIFNENLEIIVSDLLEHKRTRTAKYVKGIKDLINNDIFRKEVMLIN